MSMAHGGVPSVDLCEEKLHPITRRLLEEARRKVSLEKDELSEAQKYKQQQQQILQQKQLDWLIDRSTQLSDLFRQSFKPLKQNKKLTASTNIKNFINILMREVDQANKSSYQAGLYLKAQANKAFSHNNYKKRYIVSMLLAIAYYKVGNLDDRIYKDLLVKCKDTKPFLDVVHTMPLMNSILEADSVKMKKG